MPFARKRPDPGGGPGGGLSAASLLLMVGLSVVLAMLAVAVGDQLKGRAGGGSECL